MHGLKRHLVRSIEGAYIMAAWLGPDPLGELTVLS